MTVIRVAHAGADYDVIVGDLADALPRIKAMANGQRLPVITDARVFGLFGAELVDIVSPDPILVPVGEAAKDWRTLEHIIAELAASDVKRGTPIVALGGGSIGDVTGLAASLFKRGCPIIQIPTTLLAQADSAIGGKTAIDSAGQKNLAGTFHHPSLVIVDPSLLDSLDRRQLRSGYAEVVKYGLVGDPDFFAWCEANGASLIDGGRGERTSAIEYCVRTKARFVSADPEDTRGTRALLNFGHSFGHSIEAVAGHDVLHGEAIAVGMILAFDFSVQLGLCPEADAERVRNHFRAVGLPTSIAELQLGGQEGAIFECLLSDKKATASGVTLILTGGIGEAFVDRTVHLQPLSDFLARA
jgi:3-dehydroquinate synthase